jgi:Fe-S-cluster-containing dehydrogenase component
VHKGEDPACVSVCPTNCMYFGDLDDANSEVAQILAKRKHKVLAKEAGTDPNVYYLI